MPEDIKRAIDQGTEQMAAAAKDAADKIRDGAAKAREAFAERVVDPARRAGDAMKASGQKVAEGGSAVGMTLIDQAEKNAHEAFEAMRAAAKAKDVADVIRIQGEYLREQGQRSMAQAREISEMIMQFGKDAITPLNRNPE